MTARETYAIDLLCPQCKRSGMAHVSEDDTSLDSDAPPPVRLDSLSDGFRQISDRSAPGGIGVHCSACNVSAWK